jgi:hypothetical protein
LKASELKEEGLRLVGDLLSPNGWKRVGRQPIFLKESAPKVTSRFNYSCVLSNNPASVKVTPYVEVLHSDVENTRRAITGKRFYTINSQLQALMGDEETLWRWIFSERKAVRPVAERLVSDSLNYGVPFINQFRTLQEITTGLEALAKGHAIMRESLAICYCLQGMLDKAAEALCDEVEAARSNPRHPAHDRLVKFVEIFGVPLSL